MSDLRFDDRVAIVTGAGGGLGRQHALTLAARGAKVVINDLGGSTDGAGSSSSAADKVVEEIKAMGGEAVANYDSVAEGEKIVQTAIDTWDRIDIVINNAGILRDVSFHKMDQKDWDLVYTVHVLGAQKVTQAAWPYMREQNYGRVVMTTSAAGIYGNFGQANYSSAKLAQLGLANTLAEEGRSKNIFVNTIAPVAKSRMTENILPPQLIDELKPEYISPLVAWLCHEDCPDTKGLFEVGAGYISKLRWERTMGHAFKLGQELTPDAVAAKWDKIGDFDKSEHPADINASMVGMLGNITNPSLGGNEFIDLDECMNAEATLESSYDERDLSIYALGVGAAENPLDEKELPFVYEMSGAGFKALPTYAAMPGMNAMLNVAKETGESLLPGLNYGFDRVLHGEQYTEIKQVLKPNAKLTHTYKVKAVHDKDPHAVVVLGMTSTDEDGTEVAYNEMTTFVRGAGGWGGDRGPSGDVNVAPDREPDAVIEEKVDENQALLYRLSGDWNPLHADPKFAKAFGFEQPILHGMCTYGFCGRHVIKAFCENDPRYVKSVKVRFADSVFPGETIITRMWKESDTRIIFETKVKERDSVVIRNAAVELYDEIPAAPQKTDGGAAASEQPDTVVADDIFKGIAAHIAANSDLVAKAGIRFQFNLTDPASNWTVDLKNGAGSCVAGTDVDAEVTLELTEANLLALFVEGADAQKMYFGGDLQIGGDVMASSKLEVISDMDPQLVEAAKAERLGGGGSAAPAAGDALLSADIFNGIAAHIAATPDLVAKAGIRFQFNITAPESQWVVDLKNGAGSCVAGVDDGAEVTLELTEANLMALFVEGADAQKMYFGGDLQIGGDVMASSKLEVISDMDPKLVEAAKAERVAGGASAAPAPVEAAEPNAPKIFAALAEKMTKDADINTTILFNVTKPDATWAVDFAAGTVTEGGTEGAAILGIEDKDLANLAAGKVSAQSLYQKGQLRVDGDATLAHKLSFLDGLV